MKTFLKRIVAKADFWNLFIGIVIGFGVGVYVFSLLVPSGWDLIKMYHMENYKEFKQYQP